jgi:hypothetical protein
MSRAFISHRTELHGHCAIAREMVAQARELAERHAVPLAALRHLHAQELFARQGVADAVEHRRNVVAAVDIRKNLRPAASLAHFFEAAVQVANLYVAPDDALAVELEHDSDCAVRRRVRRPHVDQERLAQHGDLPIFQIRVYLFHLAVRTSRVRAPSASE